MEDKFITALRTLMHEGGFTTYRAFATDPDNPESIVEALIVARSPEMVEKAALDVLRTPRNSAVH